MLQISRSSGALSAALALAACGGGAPPAPPPPEVGVVLVQPRTIDHITEAPGRVQAVRRAEAENLVTLYVALGGGVLDARGSPRSIIRPFQTSATRAGEGWRSSTRTTIRHPASASTAPTTNAGP